MRSEHSRRLAPEMTVQVELEASGQTVAPTTVRPRYSLVIPVYRSAPILPELLAQIDAFFQKYPASHEVIFVNDASPDESWQVLERLRAGRADIVCIDLMRNAGQHSAVLCGLEHSRGEWVITLDDDLQNPPGEMLHLMREAEKGYDVVFGRFRRKMHGPLRKLGTRVVDWLNCRLFDKPPGLTLSNFRIIRRDVVDAACGFRTAFPYIPGLLLMSGRNFANVDVTHESRLVGESNYGVVKIGQLIWRIVFNYSAFPLRLVCLVGSAVALFSFLLGGYYLVAALLAGTRAPGWPTLVVLLSFYQGVILLVLATLGEFVVRLSNDVTRQRAYHVRTKLREGP
jgi:glycosyltransferase involved in cell wall biosynthesis